MTRRTINFVIDGIYVTPSKNNYTKTIPMFIIFLVIRYTRLKGLRSRKNRGYKYVLVVIDNFRKFVLIVPHKNKNAQTKKDSFENVLIFSLKTFDRRNHQSITILITAHCNIDANLDYSTMHSTDYGIQLPPIIQKLQPREITASHGFFLL